MPNLHLIHFGPSSCSWRVRIALAIKELDYRSTVVDVRARPPEQRPQLPSAVGLRQVPVLEVDARHPLGPARISQSLAILHWLDRAHDRPSLLPSDDAGAARAIELAEMINAGIQPLQNSGVTARLADEGIDTRAWCRHWVSRGLDALEALARETETQGEHLVGSRPSIADLCLVPQLRNARAFGLECDRWPRLAAVEAHCLALPAFHTTRPEAVTPPVSLPVSLP